MIQLANKRKALLGLGAAVISATTLLAASPAGAQTTALPAVTVRVGPDAAPTAHVRTSDNGRFTLTVENNSFVYRDLTKYPSVVKNLGANPLAPYASAGMSGDGNVVLFVDNGLNVWRWRKSTGGNPTIIAKVPASPEGRLINPIQAQPQLNADGSLATITTNNYDVAVLDMRTTTPTISYRNEFKPSADRLVTVAQSSMAGTRINAMIRDYSRGPVVFTTRTLDIATGAVSNKAVPTSMGCIENGYTTPALAGLKLACLSNGTVSILDVPTGAITTAPTNGAWLVSVKADGTRFATSRNSSSGTTLEVRVETVGAGTTKVLSNVAQVRSRSTSGSALAYAAPNSKGVSSIQTVAY